MESDAHASYARAVKTRGAQRERAGDADADGELVLVFDGVDYPLETGDCVVWPSSHPHYLRNDSNTPARAIGIATETPY